MCHLQFTPSQILVLFSAVLNNVTQDTRSTGLRRASLFDGQRSGIAAATIVANACAFVKPPIIGGIWVKKYNGHQSPFALGVGDVLIPSPLVIRVPGPHLRGNTENLFSSYRIFLYLLRYIGHEAMTSSLSRDPTRKMSRGIPRWAFRYCKAQLSDEGVFNRPEICKDG